VRVDYRPLPAVTSLEGALAAGAPVIWPRGVPRDEVDHTGQHAAVESASQEEEGPATNIHAENHFARGDVSRGFREADVVVERSYRTSRVHQCYLEPHAAVADPDPLGDGLTIYTGTQGQYTVRDEVARILSLPTSRVRVVPMTLGGGFGAKYGLVEPLVGAVALALKRPMRLVLPRSEDFLSTTPAPECVIELKTGARADGTLTALEARVLLDNGVFPAALGGIIAILLGSYYRFPNLKIDCLEVLTNKPQAGFYRAPGAAQATFAIESNIDEMARELGSDPLEFRLQNAVESGDLMSNGSPWPSLGLRQCLEKLRGQPAWLERRRGVNEGIGIAVGGWPCAMSPAASLCRVERDGTVRVHVGSVDISGVNSSMVLVAAEVLGVPPEQVEIVAGDTSSGPFAPGSGGSQITYSVAGAVAAAAREAREKLLRLAADHLEARLDDLELSAGQVQVKGVPSSSVSIGKLAGMAERKAGGPGPIIGQGGAAPEENAPGFVVHLVKVYVDPETGRVTPRRYLAVQDVGFALNPMMIEGQIHGGAVQGIGWALHEALTYDDHGQLLAGSFTEYDLPKAAAVPGIEAVLVENPSPHGPFGARGVGEPPVTAGAAAIANAVRDAVGVRVTELPIRPESLWRALREGDRG